MERDGGWRGRRIESEEEEWSGRGMEGGGWREGGGGRGREGEGGERGREGGGGEMEGVMESGGVVFTKVIQL